MNKEIGRTGPLVSIIIPCNNAERWVRECVQSCLDQTYKNIEIIFVDDGSTDKSVEIVRALKSPQIKIIEQKNKGACAARNCGFIASQGEWIQYLDADDFIGPNKIEEQLKVLAGRQDLIAVCPTIQFWDGESWKNKEVVIPKYLLNSDFPVEFIIRCWGGNSQIESGYIWTSAWLCSRLLLTRAGLWNPGIQIDQDGEYFCRVLLQSSGIRLAPRAVNYHRWRNDQGNLSAKKSVESYEARFETVLAKEKHLLNCDSGISARRAIAREFARVAIEANGRNGAVVQKSVRKIKALVSLGKDFFITEPNGRFTRKIELVLGLRAALGYLFFKSKFICHVEKRKR